VNTFTGTLLCSGKEMGWTALIGSWKVCLAHVGVLPEYKKKKKKSLFGELVGRSAFLLLSQ